VMVTQAMGTILVLMVGTLTVLHQTMTPLPKGTGRSCTKSI
jgi:hypothetical protein